MKQKVLTLAVGVTCSVIMTGCATMFGGGSNQTINIKSDKEMRVDIYKVEAKDQNVDEETKKKTKEPELMHKNVSIPSSINVQRSNNDLLLKPISEDCQEKRVEKQLNNWFWGDVLATSLLSTTVDAVTGAMWEYDKEVTLECNN